MKISYNLLKEIINVDLPFEQQEILNARLGIMRFDRDISTWCVEHISPSLIFMHFFIK